MTKVLGEGSCGKVYLSSDNKAVKVFDMSDLATRDKRKSQFEDEVTVMKALNFEQENVVTYIEQRKNVLYHEYNGRMADVYIIVMEAIDGGDFFDAVI